MERRSNVLDIVRAVTKVAPQHPEIEVWWYVPRLLDNPKVDILVEIADGRHPAYASIAQDLTELLGDVTVTVDRYGPEDVSRRLYRVLTRGASTAQPS